MPTSQEDPWQVLFNMKKKHILYCIHLFLLCAYIILSHTFLPLYGGKNYIRLINHHPWETANPGNRC